MTKGSTTVKFSYNGDSVVSMTYNGTEYWYIRNAQNDIIGLIDRTGAMVVQYAHDTWGKQLSVTGTLASTVGTINPFRYRGYVYDDESGLYYLQSRYYNPEWCRFINADDTDILEDDQNNLMETNLFVYCLNNPVNMHDPSGYAAANIIGGVVGGVTGAALGVLLARQLGLTGWKKGALIAAATIGGAALGAFLGPYVAKLGSKLISNLGLKNIAKTSTKIAKSYCFVAGTLVETQEGHIPIENVKAGDYVYAENPETGEKGLKQVVQTFENETNELVHISVNGQNISTTPEHPFYSSEKGWVDAIELRTGDKLILRSGEIVIVESVRYEIFETPITVYNFEVEDFHTYYVTSSSVLVHNSCKKDIKQITDIAKKFKIDRWGFGDYVESYKISKGLRDGATLSWKVLEKLAKEFRGK